MSWNVTLDGRTYSSLDLTLDEVEAMERLSGIAWPLLNPTRNVAAAKAFLAVFMLRDGDSDDTIMDKLGGRTLGELVGAIEWVDEPATPPLPAPRKGKRRKGDDGLDPTPGAASSPPGSTGEPGSTAGPPTSAAASG